MQIKKLIPGFLIAATGVGAGDLITGSMGGYELGLIVIWAPILGAVFKYYLTYGLAKYQLAQNETLLHGWFNNLPKFFTYIFFLYLIIWSFSVGGAIINGAGAAMNSLISIGENGKIIWGIVQTLIAIGIAKRGDFSFFSILMSVLVGVMFFTVIFMSIFFIGEDQVINTGLLSSGQIFTEPWLIGIIGGVGGTLTILSYGYWIKEENVTKDDNNNIKLDLKVSYILTGLFSMSMILLGSSLENFSGDKAQIINQLGLMLEQKFGVVGVYFFKLGFWAGIFSSMLGVWQSVPLIFSDAVSLLKNESNKDLSKTNTYLYFLLYIGLIPIVSLWLKFGFVQILYSVLGAFFVPFCAISLLILNNNKAMGSLKNTIIENIILIISLLFFLYIMLDKFLS
jgi:Mn2+/Fe2+ NRAMP family transporter